MLQKLANDHTIQLDHISSDSDDARQIYMREERQKLKRHWTDYLDRK